MSEREVILNEKLIDSKKLSEEDVLVIKALHKKLDLVANNPEDFYKPVEVISSLETALQVMWGFPTMKRFHSHWHRIKGCSCAGMDSSELFGTGLFWKNGSCPWHGQNK